MLTFRRLINSKLLGSLLIFLQAVYLIRFPLLILLLIAAFMPVTLFLWLKTLLANLYDLDSFLKTFWFSLSAFLLTFSAITTLKLILLYGGERIEFDQETREILSKGSTKYALSSIFFLAACILTALLLSGVFFFSRDSLGTKIMGSLSGFGAAMALLFLADVLQRLINRKSNAESLDRFLFPFRNPLSDWANRSDFFYRISNSVFRPNFLEKYFQKTPAFLGRGYLKYKPDGKPETDENGRVVFYPAHFTAIALFAFFFAVYIIVGWSSYLLPWLTRGTLEVTALSYLMLLLTVIVWGLTALSFLLDRYRFPVLLIIAPIYLLASVTSYDYVFPVLDLTSENMQSLRSDPLTPGKVLDATLRWAEAPEEDYAIVVAANGGGIQAAAWTARVLTGIEEKCRSGEFGPDFKSCAAKIRLISAVSGGSVGAMYFLDSYRADGIPAEKLSAVVRNAERSSLDAAAWGLVYPDFTRSLVPYFGWSYGRGHALEDEWSRGNESLNKGLFSWREGVANGWRPASIFNATVVESGQRLLFSTSDLCEKKGEGPSAVDECMNRADQLNAVSPNVREINAPSGRKSFYSFIDGKDVPIKTAVRLSASFPYVTPAPRADLKSGDATNYQHVADGGYYDNYGISSLLEWLNEGLSYKTNKNLKHIMIVQIRGDQIVESEAKEDASPRPYYQSLAPLLTLLSVRTTAQLSNNEAELEIFRRYWKANCVEISTVIFEFPREKGEDAPPLSWHLNSVQKMRIETAWNNISSETDNARVWRTFSDFIKARMQPGGNSATTCP